MKGLIIKLEEFPVQKNEQLTLSVDSFGFEAEGVCRHQGQVVFVPGALPGEEIRALIVKVQKSHAFGKLLEVTKASEARRIPPCPYYPRCGGCGTQHMSYEEELSMKRRLVQELMTRIGGLDVEVPPVLGMDDPWHYRNKTSQPVTMQSGLPAAGFYERRSHRVIATERCLIAMPQSDKASAIVMGWMKAYTIAPYDEGSHSGLVRHVMTRVSHAGECMVVLIINGNALPHQQALIEALKRDLPGFVSLCVSPNTQRGNTILGSSYQTLWGKERLSDCLCGFDFSLSPLSFFQINRAQAERLYDKALALSGVGPGDLVIDLYCGAGTISSLFAGHCRKVIGIEIVPQAVRDAIENARNNGIGNLRFMQGAAEKLMPELAREGIKPDIVVLDPPRKGAAPEVLAAISEVSAKKIVYISCNPATQARDAKILCASGYRVSAAQPVDMFCRTPDVENILLFERQVRC